MRFCNNCGNELGDLRFCEKCGADNGEVSSPVAAGTSIKLGNFTLSQKELPLILHWASIILFAIPALMLFFGCIGEAEDATVYSYLYTGSWFCVIAYFVIGMWSIIPTALFVINNNMNDKKSLIGTAIVVMIIMIVIAVISKIFEDSIGFMGVFDEMLEVYNDKIVAVIILEVLSVTAGIAGMRIKQEGER